eukprot:5201532-Pleurochrysis_carterae.AAC.3
MHDTVKPLPGYVEDADTPDSSPKGQHAVNTHHSDANERKEKKALNGTRLRVHLLVAELLNARILKRRQYALAVDERHVCRSAVGAAAAAHVFPENDIAICNILAA